MDLKINIESQTIMHFKVSLDRGIFFTTNGYQINKENWFFFLLKPDTFLLPSCCLILVHFWSVFDQFLVHFRPIFDQFKALFKSVWGPYLVHFRFNFGTFQWVQFLVKFWSILAPHRSIFRHFWTIFGPNFWLLFFTNFGLFSVHFKSLFWLLSTIFVHFLFLFGPVLVHV